MSHQNSDSIKSIDEIKFAVFGDCQTVEIALPWKHTRVAGLISWASIFQPTDNNIKSFIEKFKKSNASNYLKRVCDLDYKKNVLDYILEEKADYLIIDCNNCRNTLLTFDSNFKINQSPTLTRKGDIEFKDIEKSYKIPPKIIKSFEISYENWINIVKKVSEKILTVYKPEEIIIHEHYFSEHYIENDLLYAYDLSSPILEKSLPVLQLLYKHLKLYFKGCHIISFPHNCLGDPKHKLGKDPLHYSSLYHRYCQECLDIIFRNSEYEEIILEQKKIEYELLFYSLIQNAKNNATIKSNFEYINSILSYKNHTRPLSLILRSITMFTTYIDILEILKNECIYICCVKDTPGFYNKSHSFLLKLQSIGFLQYPSKKHIMYIGFMYKGNSTEIVGKDGKNKLSLKIAIKNDIFELQSNPYNNGNSASIKKNGIEYACNNRGINMCVFDIKTHEFLDSWSFDTHFMSSETLRRQ